MFIHNSLNYQSKIIHFYTYEEVNMFKIIPLQDLLLFSEKFLTVVFFLPLDQSILKVY